MNSFSAEILGFIEWIFSYDAANHHSQAPPWLNRSLMWAALHRLWTYRAQIVADFTSYIVNCHRSVLLLIPLSIRYESHAARD